MAVKVINNLQEFQELINSGKVVVIDFWATWCGPCRLISPKFEAFSEEYTDIVFAKVDVDEAADVAQEVGVRAMPTFGFFKNGEKIKEVVGANPSALQTAISSFA